MLKKLPKMPNLATIGQGTFMDCTQLNMLPDMLTELKTVGDFAFCNCQELRMLPNMPNLTTIGDSAFKGCEKLNTAHVPLRT